MECFIISPALSLLIKYLDICQRQKAPNFSAFHWSPHGSLVSIGQHYVTSRVVHLSKRPKKADGSGPNRRIGPGIAAYHYCLRPWIQPLVTHNAA